MAHCSALMSSEKQVYNLLTHGDVLNLPHQSTTIRVCYRNPALQAGPENEDTVDSSGHGRRKRAPRRIEDLNSCLCGTAVDVGVDPNRAIECRQPGCKTRWYVLYSQVGFIIWLTCVTVSSWLHSAWTDSYKMDLRGLRSIWASTGACGNDIIYFYFRKCAWLRS
jgi:hypothetical protein